MFHKCTIHSKRFCWWCFIQTLGFFPEHLLWDKVPGFSWLTHLVGL